MIESLLSIPLPERQHHELRILPTHDRTKWQREIRGKKAAFADSKIDRHARVSHQLLSGQHINGGGRGIRFSLPSRQSQNCREAFPTGRAVVRD